jgi:DNA-binding MarR family transcriptional regulator
MSTGASDDLIADDVVLGELEQSLGFLLRISQVNIFDVYFRHFGEHDLIPAEFSILWVLHLNPGVKQGAVADRLSIKPAHMTKLVQKLVSFGFVRRDTPEDDRRSVRLGLTAAGHCFIEENARAFMDLHQVEKGRLSESEMNNLVALLRKYLGFK